MGAASRVKTNRKYIPPVPPRIQSIENSIYIVIFLLLVRSLVVTSVSPNVVVDVVIWLKTEKLGLYKDMHTIIIAVTTCNDVLSIFFFRVVLAIIFSTGNYCVHLKMV